MVSHPAVIFSLPVGPQFDSGRRDFFFGKCRGMAILQTEGFSRCAGSGVNQSDNAALFCDADLGVGKTFIR